MAGKKGTQGSMFDDDTKGKDAPKASSQPEVEIPSVATLDGWCAFGEGQFTLPVGDFSIRVVSINPDSEIGTEPDEYYGKLWHYVRISLVHNSDGRPILSANMHWSQEDKKLPKRVLLALAGDPKVEGSGLAESATLEMRKSGWYLMLDGIDPAYGVLYGANAPQVFVR